MSSPESRLSVAGLLRLNPTPGAHRVALRAGISVGVPLLFCLAVDRPEWTLYAAFGAFTALYGRDRVHAARAVTQLSAALSLALAVLAGAIVADTGETPVLLVGMTYGLALLFITPLALLMGQLAVERPMSELLLDRDIETIVGSVVALAMMWIELRRHLKI